MPEPSYASLMHHPHVEREHDAAHNVLRCCEGIYACIGSQMQEHIDKNWVAGTSLRIASLSHPPRARTRSDVSSARRLSQGTRCYTFARLRARHCLAAALKVLCTRQGGVGQVPF
jgi:hypothetical protein